MTIIEGLESTKTETLEFFNLNGADLEKRYAPGKWTVRFLLHHLADAETVLYDRIRRTISEPRQVLPAFDQDAWAKGLGYGDMPLGLSKSVYASVRDGIIRLARLNYERNGNLEFVHSQTGVRTLKDEFDKVVWHNAHHLEQIKTALRIVRVGAGEGPPVTIETVTDGEPHLDALIDLLIDTVEAGDAVGFLPPLSRGEAARYWRGVFDEIPKGRLMLGAFLDGVLAGSVQLDPSMRTNGTHRAEVQKLFVGRRFRGRGVGRALMTALEAKAKEIGRSLLVLDTRAGDAGEKLYESLGYVRAGAIPNYALNADGTFHSTVVFHKWIGGAAGGESLG